MNVRAIRLRHGWTQQDLADHCGVSIATAQSWEQTKKGSEEPIRNPNKTNIKKIKALK